MPTSTARFRFEHRLFDFAEALSRQLAGGRRSMFIGLRADGTTRRVYFGKLDEAFDGEKKNALVGSHPVWFLYQPYDEPGSGYLEWYAMDRTVVERWIGAKLRADDFVDVRASSNRDDWPTAWRVIFG